MRQKGHKNNRKLAYSESKRMFVNMFKNVPILNYFAFSEDIFNARKQLTEIKKMVS